MYTIILITVMYDLGLDKPVRRPECHEDEPHGICYADNDDSENANSGGFDEHNDNIVPVETISKEN